MTAKPVVPRELAHRDIDDAIAHYMREGAEQAALAFIVEIMIRPRHATAGAGQISVSAVQ